MEDSPFAVRELSAPADTTPMDSPTISPVTTNFTEAPEPPIDLYEARKGRPYLADVLDIGDIYGKTDLDGSIKSINDYILMRIESQFLKPTKMAFQQVLGDIQQELGVSSETQISRRLEMLTKYINLVSEEEELDLKRRKLFSV